MKQIYNMSPREIREQIKQQQCENECKRILLRYKSLA